jgi:ureidoacrylate peracid hydrolase
MPQEILKTLEEWIDPKHTALVVIDPQNDFCASDGAAARLMGTDVSRIQKAVQPLNAFIETARKAGLMIVWTRSLVDLNMKK